MSSQAGRALEIRLQAVLGLPAPLPPCHGALPGLPVVQPGCPYLLGQKRALWHTAVGLKLEVTEVGGYLMALSSEIIIQAVSRRRWHARKKESPCQQKR